MVGPETKHWQNPEDKAAMVPIQMKSTQIIDQGSNDDNTSLNLSLQTNSPSLQITLKPTEMQIFVEN